jgi:D-amino-acid dehydrogenase
MLRDGGLDRYAVTSQEIRQIEPTLRGEFYGGYFTPSDSTGDIHKFTRGLAHACERHGVKFQYDTTVHNVRRLGDQGFAVDASIGELEYGDDFGYVVICAGVKSRKFASMLGDRVNVYPVKGYSITVCLDDKKSRANAPWVSLLDESAKIVTSRLGADRFRVAGTTEINGFNRDIRATRIEPLVEWSRRHFPQMSTARVIPWAGLRPMMPSMLPRVGTGRGPGTFYNTGHGHLGWTLPAATAQVLADCVVRSAAA